jgi:hypothetical protein
MPLGHFLLEQNVVDPRQLEAARHRQKVSRSSLAESLVALGFISREELDALLDRAPLPPDSIEETGLDSQFLLNFLLKVLYVYGYETAPLVSELVKLPIHVTEELLDILKEKRLVEVLGLTDALTHTYRYALTGTGRQWALEALAQCQYTGPLPVPLSEFQLQVAKQAIGRERVTPEAMAKAVSHLVLTPNVMLRLGPAVSAARAILLYGPPGNGKTSIAEALGSVYEQPVFLPHCVSVDGQIVKLFDPAVHELFPEPVSVTAELERSAELELELDEEPEGSAQPEISAPFEASPTPDPVEHADPRWVRCRRPVVVTAGELTMEMLDLQFDSVSKYYEAPAHIKAVGGVFIIDDFGRQRVTPAELVNRWILPLERRVDYLTLHTGKKLEMPFDELVVFSTNYPPGEIMDGAALRRIPYKFYLDEPSREQYVEIFRRVCEAHRLTPRDEVISHLLDVFYPESGVPLSGAHPVFIVQHAIERCRFEDAPIALSTDVVREAVENIALKG